MDLLSHNTSFAAKPLLHLWTQDICENTAWLTWRTFWLSSDSDSEEDILSQSIAGEPTIQESRPFESFNFKHLWRALATPKPWATSTEQTEIKKRKFWNSTQTKDTSDTNAWKKQNCHKRNIQSQRRKNHSFLWQEGDPQKIYWNCWLTFALE